MISDLLEIFGALIGMVLFVIISIAGAWLLSTALSAVAVAALWNWFGLHAYFHLATLGFWQALGAGAALNIFDGIFSARDGTQRFTAGWKAGKEKNA